MSSEASRRRGSGSSRFHDDDEPALADITADDTGQQSGKRPDDPERRARDAVYQLLTVRARSRSELTQALLRKGIEEDLADSVVQKFVDAGLVDDASFAESWVHSRHQHQGLGRKALGFQLRRKGVDEHVVADALSLVDEESEAERARELVRHKLNTMTVTDNTARMRRLIGMLARKGYSESLAFRIVREELEHFGFDGDDPDHETP
jgi:regulatory protein